MLRDHCGGNSPRTSSSPSPAHLLLLLLLKQVFQLLRRRRCRCRLCCRLRCRLRCCRRAKRAGAPLQGIAHYPRASPGSGLAVAWAARSSNGGGHSCTASLSTAARHAEELHRCVARRDGCDSSDATRRRAMGRLRRRHHRVGCMGVSSMHATAAAWWLLVLLLLLPGGHRDTGMTEGGGGGGSSCRRSTRCRSAGALQGRSRQAAGESAAHSHTMHSLPPVHPSSSPPAPTWASFASFWKSSFAMQFPRDSPKRRRHRLRASVYRRRAEQQAR